MTREEIIAGLIAVIRSLDVTATNMRDEFGKAWLEMHDMSGGYIATPVLTAQAQAYAALVAIMAVQ